MADPIITRIELHRMSIPSVPDMLDLDASTRRADA